MKKGKTTNYCPRCGKELHDTESFCGNCGYGLNQSNQYSSYYHPKESSSNNWIYICALILIICIITFFKNNSVYNSNKSNTISQLVRHELTQGEIQSIKEIDAMRMAINNTIWTHTEVGDIIWTKLEFKDNKVKIYNAMPSDGKWTFEEECPYTLEEGRYFDDGRRYIAAVFKSKDIDIPEKFTITNGHLYMLGFDIAGFILGDYEWD